MGSKHRSKQPDRETRQASDSKQDLVEFVTNLPEERRRDLVEVLAVSTRIEKTFSGPLPAPEDFEHYNKIWPDAAHRIMAMAKKNARERSQADQQRGRNLGSRSLASPGLRLGWDSR